jgi:pimeloyl-ACP methyl ester carboxylesterase
MKRVVVLLFSLTLVLSCTEAKIETKSKGVALHDNTVVHYREAGQGPVLLLIHGLGSSSESWINVMEPLARGYRVIAIDLPGYGKSDKPGADYSLLYHAGAVKEFMQALGLTRVSLAGNSLGGWIAALIALDDPERVSNLILVNSAGLRRDAAASVNLNPATREEEKNLLLALFSNKTAVTEKLVTDQWEYRKEIRQTVTATQESFKAVMPLLDNRLKDIKVPTLIIWGREDSLIPLDVAERFNKGIPGSKLVVIEQAGHLPQIEQPAAFVTAVKGFVKSW